MRSINISQHQPTGPHSAGAVRLISIWSMQNYNLYYHLPHILGIQVVCAIYAKYHCQFATLDLIEMLPKMFM